jgi:predicted RNA-binding protein
MSFRQFSVTSKKAAKEPEKTIVLLRQLCYGPGTWDKMEQANINLKENGLARTEKRQGADWIMIKSEMIKEFVIQDILKDAEIFPTGELPMLLNQDKLDILQFLTTVLKHFDPVIIHDAYGWTKKSHELSSQVGVPQEDVYQQQFGATVRRAFLNQEWKAYSELRRDVDEQFRKDQNGKVDPKEAKSLTLDFMLLRPKTDKIKELRVGIEFTASVNLLSLKEHAKRRYSQVLKLDQYVVVNFTSYRTEGEFACDKASGFDKNGHQCDIPIYHVLHDRDYKSVKLYHNKNQPAVDI